MEYDDQTISLLKKRECINEDALNHELAAKFYLAKGKDAMPEIGMFIHLLLLSQIENICDSKRFRREIPTVAFL